MANRITNKNISNEKGSVFFIALAVLAAIAFTVFYFVTDSIHESKVEKARTNYDYWHPKKEETSFADRGPGGYQVTFQPNLP